MTTGTSEVQTDESPDVNVTLPDGSQLAKETTLGTVLTALGTIAGKLLQGVQTIPNSLSVNPATASTWDVLDRAGRLLGVVYGSVGSVKQGVQAIADALSVTPATSSTWDVADRAARIVGYLTGPDGNALFPAAAAPADAMANAENTPSIRARQVGFNGTTWDRVRAGVTALGTPTGFLNALVAAVYNASPTTRTEGQAGPLQGDLSGNLSVTMGTNIAGEDRSNTRLRVYTPNGYTHLAAVATTTIKSGAGVLHSVTISTKSAATGTMTIYDNTAGSGTVIAIIDLATQLGTLVFDVNFTTGLTVVIANFAGDVTVSSF